MDSKTYNMIKAEMYSNLDILMNYMAIIVPTSDDDKKILSIGYDMLKSMKEDMGNPSTIHDVLDIDALIKDWDVIEAKITDVSGYGITKIMDQIAEAYSIPEGDDDD